VGACSVYDEQQKELICLMILFQLEVHQTLSVLAEVMEVTAEVSEISMFTLRSSDPVTEHKLCAV